MIEKGFNIPSEIPAYNKDYYTLILGYTILDKQKEPSERRVKLITKDILAYEKAKLTAEKLGCEYLCILHNPMVKDEVKEVKSLSNSHKKKATDLVGQGLEAAEIAEQLGVDVERVEAFLNK